MSSTSNAPNLTPIDLSAHQKSQENNTPLFARLNLRDAVFAVLTVALFAYGAMKNWGLMDIYEQVILVFSVASIIALGWFWRPLQWVFGWAAVISLGAVAMYAGDLARGETAFGLKYMFASQPLVMWMSVLFILATLSYWVGLIWTRATTMSWLGSKLTFAGLVAGTAALAVRWHEGYLIAPDVGHIPVSNLYEVFILFALLTTVFYLYYEEHYDTKQLGAFVMLIVVASVGFLLWYSIERGQQEIKPLIPALQSWWMKIHVPANFVGYGTFSIAAMVGFAYLVKFVGTPFAHLPAAFQATYSQSGALPAATDANAPQILADMQAQHAKRTKILTIVLWVLGACLFIEPMVFRKGITAEYLSTYWAMYFGTGLLIVGFILLWRKPLATRLPDFAVLDDIMYKAIAVGFVFFTIATILGAFWAADAWGKYWSWDPKETWALIVWLNYAAWLHLRLMAGMRGTRSALWALVGLLITGFAFLGVNIFLSGLHSYGTL
jgi:cytochrome c-type biogenesis protein CcsB